MTKIEAAFKAAKEQVEITNKMGSGNIVSIRESLENAISLADASGSFNVVDVYGLPPDQRGHGEGHLDSHGTTPDKVVGEISEVPISFPEIANESILLFLLESAGLALTLVADLA